MGLPKKSNLVRYDFRSKKPIEDEPRNSIKDDLKEALQEAKGSAQGDEDTEEGKRPRKAGSGERGAGSPITFNCKNNRGNLINSVGDNNRFTIKTKKVVKTTSPALDTIGANGQAMEAINGWIKRLAEARIKRFGKEAQGKTYVIITDKFKRDFGIPKKDTRRIDNLIKALPISRTDEVIQYFQEKYEGTITGKIKGAAEREGHIPPFEVRMTKESSLLKIFSLQYKSPEVREALYKYFGVRHHTELAPNEHMNWIAHLAGLVDKVMSGEDPQNIRL